MKRRKPPVKSATGQRQADRAQERGLSWEHYNSHDSRKIPSGQLNFNIQALAPDFRCYPWAGILRVLYISHRRGLYHLADLAYQQFRKEAQNDS